MDSECGTSGLDPTLGQTLVAQQSFTVQLPLDSKPRAAVMIEISSSDQTEVMVIPSIIVFTPTDYMVPQTVQLIGQDDSNMDGDTIVRITLTTHSTDQGYADVSWFFYMYNNDDDGLTLSRDSCVVSEWGDTCKVGVSMRAWRDQEYKLMEFSVFSSDEGEGYGTPGAIQFDKSNWNVPQYVTIHGMDDLIDDGDVSFRIDLVGMLTFQPGHENEKNSFSVTINVVNKDDDTGGVTVVQKSNTTNEQGTLTAAYTVRLLTEPVKPVSIPSQVLAKPGEAPEGRVVPMVLVFNKDNWMKEQKVTVVGMNDWVVDYAQPYTVQIGPSTSVDLPYQNKHMSTLNFINLDDDKVGLTAELRDLNDPTKTRVPQLGFTSEDGTVGPEKLYVRLASEPKSTVLFTVSSTAPQEGTVTPNIVAFSSDDWNMEQTLTVTGEDDAFLDGNSPYSVVIATLYTADPDYGAAQLGHTVKFVNYDDPTDRKADECEMGLYGYVNVETGLYDCRKCPIGTYQPKAGQANDDSCIGCGLGEFVLADAVPARPRCLRD